MNRRNKRKDHDKPNLMTNGRGSLFSSPVKKQAIVCVNKPTHAERNPLTLDSVSQLRTDEYKKALRRGRMVAEEQRVQSALKILLSLKLSSNPVEKQIEETDPSNFILRVN